MNINRIKLLAPVFGVLAVAAPVFSSSIKANPENLAALNAAIAQAIAPFNNPVSKAAVAFSDVATSEVRAVHVLCNLSLSKKGPGGVFEAAIPYLEYSFPETSGSAPEAKVQLAIKQNLLKRMPREMIDKMGEDTDKFVEQFLRSQAAEYANAAEFSARVTRKEKDAEGHLTAIGVSLNSKVDLSKMRNPERALFTGLHLDAVVTLENLEITASVRFNPAAREFRSEEKGLKEYLEGLMAKDPREIREIQDFVKFFDQMAGSTVR